MEDYSIIELYFQRSENAIYETDLKYHDYCENIGMNILNNHQDTEECINDLYLKIWNAIPPQKPTCFHAFLGKIMRNLSLDRFRKRTTQKRRDGDFYILLSELEECIPSTTSVWKSCSEKLLTDLINEFLDNINEIDRVVFVKRYFFCEKISQIAVDMFAYNK